jgi:hypothetical protein
MLNQALPISKMSKDTGELTLKGHRREVALLWGMEVHLSTPNWHNWEVAVTFPEESRFIITFNFAT